MPKCMCVSVSTVYIFILIRLFLLLSNTVHNQHVVWFIFNQFCFSLSICFFFSYFVSSHCCHRLFLFIFLLLRCRCDGICCYFFFPFLFVERSNKFNFYLKQQINKYVAKKKGKGTCGTHSLEDGDIFVFYAKE